MVETNFDTELTSHSGYLNKLGGNINSGLNVITECLSSVYPLPDPVLFLSDVSFMTDYHVNIRSLTQISMSTK